MDADSFWNLMEQSRRQSPEPESRLRWLREELIRRPLGEVVGFQARLEEAAGEAFTWEVWAAADRMLGGRCSDDGFCYFGLWMVGLGREVFARAVADPDALAEAPEVQKLAGRPREMWGDDWPDWGSLDNVAVEAYEELTGAEDECGEEFFEAVQAERRDDFDCFTPRGEKWDVRAEGEVARRLPRLGVLFPLGALP